MKNMMTTRKALAVAGMTMGLALGARAEWCTNCLTFSSSQPFGLLMEKGTSDGKQAPWVNLEWSTNRTDWMKFDQNLAKDTYYIDGHQAGKDGDLYKIYLRGTNNTYMASSNQANYVNRFTNAFTTANLQIDCTGNIETLLDYKTVAGGEHPMMDKYAFAYLFRRWVALRTPPELPATNLTDGCYYLMFSSCPSLTNAPALPATIMAFECYRGMFKECCSMRTPPILHSTNLAEGCYRDMFYRSSGLIDTPELPATELKNRCYREMFSYSVGDLSVNANPPGKAWSLPKDAKSVDTPATESESWNYRMFNKAVNCDISNEVFEVGRTYYVASAPKAALTVTPVTGASVQKVMEETWEVTGPSYSVYQGNDVAITYEATNGYTFPGGKTTWSTNFTASAASMTVTLTDVQKPIAKSHVIGYAYKTNDVSVAGAGLAGLVNNAQKSFREIDDVVIETDKISLPKHKLVKAEPGSWKAGEKTDDLEVTVSFERFQPVTVAVPEVAGATAQLLVFDVNGGWASVATNEVPSNATVRVVWTVTEAGKALSGEGAVSVCQWQTEFVASNSVQTAPQPIVGEAGVSEITLNIDTRAKKTYFDAADILSIWSAANAEVKVKGEGEGEAVTIVRNAANTNTVRWVPSEQGTYNFSQDGFNDAQIIYTTPVEVTTNGLGVTGTTVAVTADDAPIQPQTEGKYAGKLMVASNSTVTATWTATGSGVYFMDGSTTFTKTFEAGQSVNPVSEAVTKPEEPKAPKLKLGVVAQRYPWDGKVDVQYWAQNAPNEGYQITVTVTLPDGTAASETYDCKNGKNTVAFDARAKFGEVQFKGGVKVKATLNKAE